MGLGMVAASSLGLALLHSGGLSYARAVCGGTWREKQRGVSIKLHGFGIKL